MFNIKHADTFILLLIIALIFASCKQNTDGTVLHPHIKQLIDRASVLRTSIGPEKADRLLDSAYAPKSKLSDGDIIEIYAFKAESRLFAQQDIKSEAYVDSALAVLNNHKDSPAYALLFARLNTIKGRALVIGYHYNRAFQTFYRAKLAISNNTDSTASLVMRQIDNCLAAVLLGQQRNDEAAEMYKESLHLIDQSSLDFLRYAEIQGAYDNVGIAYNRENKPDSALKYFNAGLQFIETNQAKFPDQARFNESAKAVFYGNRAKAYVALHQYNQAERDDLEGIKVNSQKGYDLLDAYHTKLGLGNLYLLTNRPERAATILNDVENCTDNVVKNNAEIKAQHRHLKTAYLQKTGNYKQANNYLQEDAAVLNYTLEKNGKQQLDFKRDFELLDQKYKFDALSKENQLKDLYLFGSMVIFVLLVIIIALFVVARNRARANMANMQNYNQQLKLAVQSVEQRNKEFGQLINILGHDLKNPITAIGKIAEVLLITNDKTEEDVKMIKLIQTSSTDLDMTVTDLIQLENPLTDTNVEIINLEDLLTSTVALMQHRADEKQQQICLSTAGPVMVQINREKIWRVFNNLLVNAIKFSNVNAAINVKMTKLNGKVQIAFSDTGVGIPEKLQPQIFELFTSAKRRGTLGEKSFGLGLHTSKQIIEANHGKIWFTSEEGAGSTFYVSFPIT